MRKVETLTGYTAQELPCERLDVVTWEGSEIVLLQKVVDTHAQELGDETYVVSVIKPV